MIWPSGAHNDVKRILAVYAAIRLQGIKIETKQEWQDYEILALYQ